MKKVVVLRGIPGSGKSTYAQRQFADAEICSADHFHVDANGVYNWRPEYVAAAHTACKDRFINLMDKDVPLIVVDNTNTQIWEMKQYIDMAKLNGYEVQVIRLHTDAETAASRCVHNVPAKTVQRMYDRFESFPGETLVTQ